MDLELYKTYHVPRHFSYNCYFTSASLDKPTLLFLHGFPSSSFDWRKQVPYFESRGYGILAPDLLGAGKTSHPVHLEAFRLHDMAADLISILDAEGISKVVAIAHDWGTVLMSTLSAVYPTRFMGFVWLGGGFIPPHQDEFTIPKLLETSKQLIGYEAYAYWEYFEKHEATEDIKQNVESFVQLLYPKDPLTWRTYMALPGKTEEWMKSGLRPGRPGYMTDAEFEKVSADFLASGIESPLGWYRCYINNLNQEDNLRITPENMTIKSPSLFIAASKDYICVPFVGKLSMDTYGTDVTSVEFDTGHWIQLECPEKVNEVICDWLLKSVL